MSGGFYEMKHAKKLASMQVILGARHAYRGTLRNLSCNQIAITIFLLMAWLALHEVPFLI